MADEEKVLDPAADESAVGEAVTPAEVEAPVEGDQNLPSDELKRAEESQPAETVPANE